MKLLVDMNLSPRWIALLTNAGWEAVHWSAVGRADALDSEIMGYAQKHNCAVLTHDLDFSAILAATHGQKPSVIQIRADDISPDAIGNHILFALTHLAAELELGAIVTVTPAQTRVRMLPLGES